MTEERLDSDIELKGQPLKSIVGQSTDDVEILGYAVMYTAGADWNVLVPRDWLLAKCYDLGIDEMVIPSEPRPSSAYKRAIKRLSEDDLDDTKSITIPRLDNQIRQSHPVNLSVRSGDSVNMKHLYAEVFYDSRETGEEGGRWEDIRLGFFDYDSDTQNVLAFADDDLQGGSELAKLWSHYSTVLRSHFHEMLETHIGLDIRLMMYHTTKDHTRSVVSLRDGGGVYFFPAGMTDFVESMSELYAEINETYKKGGGTMAVRTLPVLDSESEREWIEERVRKSLEESVEKVIDEAYEQYVDGDAHGEVLAAIRENLGEHAETAEMYNALLEVELDIEEMMADRGRNLDDDDKQELIDMALETATVTD